MNPDLQALIELQALDSERDRARQAIEAMPERRQAVERDVAAQEAALAAARERLAANQATRRALEKDLAVVQGRLTKFKDQLMEVKTNREYQAMQHEIATAQAEVQRHEDLLLERMVEADELTAAVEAAKVDLEAAQRGARDAIAALDGEERRLRAALDVTASRRDELTATMARDVLALFDFVRAHRGTAVVEARDGHCTLCHVRLRPQVFNEIRRNEAVIKCDSCGRILYYLPPAASAGAVAQGAS